MLSWLSHAVHSWAMCILGKFSLSSIIVVSPEGHACPDFVFFLSICMIIINSTQEIPNCESPISIFMGLTKSRTWLSDWTELQYIKIHGTLCQLHLSEIPGDPLTIGPGLVFSGSQAQLWDEVPLHCPPGSCHCPLLLWIHLCQNLPSPGRSHCSAASSDCTCLKGPYSTLTSKW